MPLTPEQITQLRSQAGLSPIPPTQGSTDILAKRKAALAETPEPTLQYNASKPFDHSLEAIGERVGTVAGAVGDVAKGVYDTGKKIAKSVVTAPVTIATGVGEATGLLKPGSTYAPEGTYQSEVKQKMEEPGQTPFTAALGTGSEAILDVATAGEGASLLKNKAIPAVTKAITSKLDTAAANKAVKETSKITEMISPKLTPKEIKLAQSEGRIISGKDATYLKGGTPDTVIPSDKVVEATQVIQREIPNASKLKSPELYTALEGRTSDMAQKLVPEMKKVPIKPETVSKITDQWSKVKKAQIDNAYIPSDVNVKKLQADFESRLMKSKSGNMNDLWDTAKAYDASVPANVKKANSLSSESLQAKKEIWLQNRAVLRDAIKDTKSGLGEIADKAFSDMHYMYDAKENLQSKAELLGATPSKIKQWIKENPWKSAFAGYVTGKAVEGSTGINIPGI